MERSDYIIHFESDKLGYKGVELLNPHHTGIFPGVTVLAGGNGTGKTTLATILEKGRYAYGNRLAFSPADLKVKMLSFSDIHSLSGMEVTYYHQRMEATANDYVPDVKEIMRRRKAPVGWLEKCEEFGLKNVADKKINYLSSGELRKLLIVNALLSDPDVIVLDNPYIGLDAHSREEFDNTMRRLRDKGTTIVMALCDFSDIPDYTDNLILLDNLTISSAISDKNEIDRIKSIRMTGKDKHSFLKNYADKHTDVIDQISERSIKAPPKECDLPSPAFEIRNGNVRYGDKTIFSGVDWRVERGECWALQGKNGSGKSLLLSLICADNPQSYSNDLSIFGRRRGSGESIFEIKDRIGYVSPEMQLYFKSSDIVEEIIIQGKRNSLNRYHSSSEEERMEAKRWMEKLGITKIADCLFSELSSGEQRLVLLARAFIKRPDLLILDEPFHGLDAEKKETVRNIINDLVKKNNTTLIFVTHYDSEIPPCVDHFFNLSENRIISPKIKSDFKDSMSR